MQIKANKLSKITPEFFFNIRNFFINKFTKQENHKKIRKNFLKMILVFLFKKM